MKYSFAVSASLALAGFTSAIPLAARDAPQASDIIAQIAPTSTSCADTTECRTNVQVAPFFIDAFWKYGLKSYGQIAAVLSLTAFESVGYKFKHNVSPGVAGQGTSNLQMLKYNIEYANSIPELKDQVAALGTIDATDSAKANQLLALVTPDQYNFGSGPWFLTTQCDPKVAEALISGTDEAFAGYMACVGVQVTPDRKEYWVRAKAAFGLK
ncbi:hypothetical protein E0Z10_g5452 [Xylaria hypoxylon]|uniref:Uncharacterized protein n=1 Tax=Xylaria hypoxylon TaxID=37992 RepID=A0A4Z0Z139_9PEZI|nr:hypothetical protein E0Z10_g5452 [Xylaria hypoxylon]